MPKRHWSEEPSIYDLPSSVSISTEQIEKYREIYKADYGREIDFQRAYTELNALVCLLHAAHIHINKDVAGWHVFLCEEEKKDKQEADKFWSTLRDPGLFWTFNGHCNECSFPIIKNTLWYAAFSIAKK